MEKLFFSLYISEQWRPEYCVEQDEWEQYDVASW